ncbi:hypothetical protein A3C26_01890 [Candidatus Daviesbacteria bacterium RIFCSPHIGHO2_02_FULL_39_12]|uniref:HTH-like domain-containing protein n=2 Tax=Candidatus Daviesiibacteriota TaxID=1752718 RepID=A0A1F5JDB6_9BACT|nr:MAG: hypothetical protein A3C26_01890 [Candidatus Daviesbacteria bacterium RIFCSPHIGHO2_02_FULL_39_12]OGE71531.1 MAG: hypothetical protein A3H40_00705 [Candidatus Daviesbacteria bacterium RIFCSPLOWO2_02_FULL_38_15]
MDQKIRRVHPAAFKAKVALEALKDENHLSPREIVSHINKTSSVLPLGIQTELLGISRNSLYYHPKPVDPETLTVMNRIDELYTRRPFYGSRRIARDLGYNRKRVQRLMREMGIEAIYQKPNLSKNNLPHPVYPYLLKGVIAGHPNHIWGTDIIPLLKQNVIFDNGKFVN